MNNIQFIKKKLAEWLYGIFKHHIVVRMNRAENLMGVCITVSIFGVSVSKLEITDNQKLIELSEVSYSNEKANLCLKMVWTHSCNGGFHRITMCGKETAWCTGCGKVFTQKDMVCRVYDKAKRYNVGYYERENTMGLTREHFGITRKFG